MILGADNLHRTPNLHDLLRLSLPAVVVDSLAEPSVSSDQPALAKLSISAVACIAFAADLLQIKLTSRTVSCIQRISQAPADIEARLRLLGEIFAGVLGFIQAGQICYLICNGNKTVVRSSLQICYPDATQMQADAFVGFTQQHGNGASGRAAYQVPLKLHATTVTQADYCSHSQFSDNNKERLSLQFLRQWRRGTEKDDLWDACIVAVLKELLEEGPGPHRPSSAQSRSPAYDLLAQAETAAWMHRIIIALVEPKGRQGALAWHSTDNQ